MFCVTDREKGFSPIKSGFKSASQANDWCKKHLSLEDVRLWGDKRPYSLTWIPRYHVVKK